MIDFRCKLTGHPQFYSTTSTKYYEIRINSRRYYGVTSIDYFILLQREKYKKTPFR